MNNKQPGRRENISVGYAIQMVLYVVFFFGYMYLMIQAYAQATSDLIHRFGFGSVLLAIAMLIFLPLLGYAVYRVGKTLLVELPNAPRQYQYRCKDCSYQWLVRQENSKAEMVMLSDEPIHRITDPNLKHWKEEQTEAIEHWKRELEESKEIKSKKE